MRVTSLSFRKVFTFCMSCTGIPSVMQTMSFTPASAASMMASAAKGGGNEDHGGVAVRGLFGFRYSIEDGDLAFKELAALAGGHAGDDVGAEVHAVFGVECAGAAGDALHDQTGVLVNERCHCRNK